MSLIRLHLVIIKWQHTFTSITMQFVVDINVMKDAGTSDYYAE